MPIRRSQKKRNAEPRPKQNQRRLVIDPMVNPGSSAHRHQARSKAHPTRTHHRMVTLAQSSPGDRSACAPQSKMATVMLGSFCARKRVKGLRGSRANETSDIGVKPFPRNHEVAAKSAAVNRRALHFALIRQPQTL